MGLCTGTVAYMAPEVLDGSMCPAAGAVVGCALAWCLVLGAWRLAHGTACGPGRCWTCPCARPQEALVIARACLSVPSAVGRGPAEVRWLAASMAPGHGKSDGQTLPSA